MKLALLTQAPVRSVKQSHPSFVGKGRYRLNVCGNTKLTAHIQPLTAPAYEINGGDEFEGPCSIVVTIVEALEDKLSVYAEKI